MAAERRHGRLGSMMFDDTLQTAARAGQPAYRVATITVDNVDSETVFTVYIDEPRTYGVIRESSDAPRFNLLNAAVRAATRRLLEGDF